MLAGACGRPYDDVAGDIDKKRRSERMRRIIAKFVALPSADSVMISYQHNIVAFGPGLNQGRWAEGGGGMHAHQSECERHHICMRPSVREHQHIPRNKTKCQIRLCCVPATKLRSRSGSGLHSVAVVPETKWEFGMSVRMPGMV